jgi:hypothetical protein
MDSIVIQAPGRMHRISKRSLIFIKERLRLLARKTLSVSTRRTLVRYTCWPPLRGVRFGSLRRLKPISPHWGSERGLPIDRYYIEQFLSAHASDIQGHGLEIKEDLYSTRFGANRITKIDILHPKPDNPKATIVANLTRSDNLPANTFDFIILTQTLQFIYEFRAAIGSLFHMLKPGGILLATVFGISKISREDMDLWGHYWAFTTRSAEQLFHEFFPDKNVQVQAHGNVLSAIAFLHGLASEELRREELDCHDPDFQVLITIRAVKPKVTA